MAERSSQPPHNAADIPRNMIPSVNTTLTLATVQSQLVAVSRATIDMLAGHASGCVIPMAWLSGSQNTLMP